MSWQVHHYLMSKGCTVNKEYCKKLYVKQYGTKERSRRKINRGWIIRENQKRNHASSNVFTKLCFLCLFPIPKTENVYYIRGELL